MDIRAPGKMYDEFTRRAMEEYGTEYIRGRVSQIYPDGQGQLAVLGVDTLLGRPVEVHADLVVLAVGIEASKGAPQLAEKLRILRQLRLLRGKPWLKLQWRPTPPAYSWPACARARAFRPPWPRVRRRRPIKGPVRQRQTESSPQIAQVDIRRVSCDRVRPLRCPSGAIISGTAARARPRSLRPSARAAVCARPPARRGPSSFHTPPTTRSLRR